MYWSYDNALHFGLSMFVEFKKLPYPSVISISVMLNVLPHITKLYKHEQAIMERVNISLRRYNTLYHRNYCIFFSDIRLVLGYLQCATTRYHNFSFLNTNIFFFINLTVTRGNELQIVPNLAKLKKCMVTCVTTRWNYGKTLHYGLSILNWEKMYGNACTHVVTRVVTRWSYVNALHYGLSMSVRFGNVW